MEMVTTTTTVAERTLLPTRDWARHSVDVPDAPGAAWMYRTLPDGTCPDCAGSCSSAKRTAQAVDGDQLLSTGTSGISSPLCPLFLRQITLPGPGRGLCTEPAHSFTPGEEPESAEIVFSADDRELTACVMSKAAAGEEFPLLSCTCFSATAARGSACAFLGRGDHLARAPDTPPAPGTSSLLSHSQQRSGISQLRVSWPWLVFLWCPRTHTNTSPPKQAER